MVKLKVDLCILSVSMRALRIKPPIIHVAHSIPLRDHKKTDTVVLTAKQRGI